jgi:hypothetical protein
MVAASRAVPTSSDKTTKVEMGTRSGIGTLVCSGCGGPSRIHGKTGDGRYLMAWCDHEACARADIVDIAAGRHVHGAAETMGPDQVVTQVRPRPACVPSGLRAR